MLLAALLGYGAVRVRQVARRRRGTPVQVGIVQANISRYGRMAAEQGTFGAVETILAAHDAAVAQAPAPRRRSTCWSGRRRCTRRPSARRRVADGAAFDRAIAASSPRTGVPLVFGAYDARTAAEFNAAVFLEPPDGGRARVRDLSQGVAVPADRAACPAGSTGRDPALAALARHLDAGPRRRRGAAALRDGGVLRVAPLICYDVLEPGARARRPCRGGADAARHAVERRLVRRPARPRGGTSSAAAFRSVETRRPQVRATNTGISAVIDARGSISAATALGERAVLTERLTPQSVLDAPALRWGGGSGPRRSRSA